MKSPVSESSVLRHKPHQHLFQSMSRSSSRPSGRLSSRNTSPTREVLNHPPVAPDLGPRAFFARWQALLDDTAITPATLEGPIRYGRNKGIQQSSKVDVDEERKGPTWRQLQLMARETASNR